MEGLVWSFSLDERPPFFTITFSTRQSLPDDNLVVHDSLFLRRGEGTKRRVGGGVVVRKSSFPGWTSFLPTSHTFPVGSPVVTGWELW